TEKAGFDLLPAAGWLLLRIKRHGTVEPARLAEVAPVPLQVINEAARQLEGRGLVRRVGVQMVLTEPGAEAVVKLAQAREDSLAELLGDWWGPDRPTDLVALVSELTAETSGSSKERPHSPEPKRDHAARHPRRAE
ncbi:EmrB/QacA family drug resistance transporter, partial [Streptomyces sp. A1136]